jgi:RHS repeat-associated protein
VITCKQTAIVICTALMFLIASQLMAGDAPGIGKHYLVELDEASLAVSDTTEVARDLSKLYGGHPETSGIPGFHGFAMSMNPERAQLLGKDPRVKSIREAPVPVSPRKILAEDVPLPPITVGPFKYDGAGNIIHMGDDRYTYDEMSRITSGTAVTSQNTATQQFEYDGFGNLKKETDPGKTLFIDTDSATNRLIDTSGPETGTNVLHIWGGAYDLAGNQLAESGTVAYAYDSMNMMSERTWPNHEMYLYDADDERVATVIYSNAQSSTWRYTLRDESHHVLRTLTDLIVGGAHSWQQTEDYVYGPAGLLAAITPQGSAESRKHFHHDHLGSAVLITDDNGQRVASHKYWPFGADAAGSDNDGERMKFTGHERDLSGVYGDGLDYMHARYYTSNVGRFLSVDPEGFDFSHPLSWNRYSYVSNNPVDRVDLDGWVEVDLYIRHFIASPSVQLPHGENRGDGRTFSLMSNASSRTQQHIRIETDPKRSKTGELNIDPTTGRSKNLTFGLTGQASTDDMRASVSRTSDGSVLVHTEQNVLEPFPVSLGAPQLLGAGIRSTVDILVSSDGRQIKVTGSRSSYPSMEINAQVGNQTFSIFRGRESTVKFGIGILGTTSFSAFCAAGASGHYNCGH